ncbi:hypothetical protein [Wolbachia endosymbiont of Mansonella ozzardi]|uniref:hypothetical protein n=1 Tax=Wolbachia endosymbiont of Mansonella ozzardi TaxID=137464 RepID=UPI001CE1302F|nr:hypothetical protein [Wolbachia endosymbiont of Mansonella ozzardi]
MKARRKNLLENLQQTQRNFSKIYSGRSESTAELTLDNGSERKLPEKVTTVNAGNHM